MATASSAAMSESPRLDTIEIKLVHLEQALTQLSDAVIRQQRDIEALQAQVRHFKEQMQTLETPPASDGYEKPPHY
jgi:uncharacterized coiled-coil protein SlyX